MKSGVEAYLLMCPGDPAADGIEEMIVDVGGGDFCSLGEGREIAGEDRPVLDVLRNATVRAANECGVERDDLHEETEAKFLFDEAGADGPFRMFELRIEEEFERVVAGLAVDVDGPREVRRAVVIKPAVIREPTAGVGNGDEVAGAQVIETGQRPPHAAENLFDTLDAAEHIVHILQNRPVVHIDMRHLVVGDRERPAAARIEHFVPSSSRKAIQPFSRKTRLMCTGRSTAVMPYSDTMIGLTARFL